MSFNLGLAAAAYQGGKEEQRRLNSDDYLAKQRDFESQKMTAGLSTLADQTAAEQARLRLSGAQSEAGLSTLPGQTANTLAQQKLNGIGLDFKTAQQPTEQANAVKQTAVAGATLDRELLNIPRQAFEDKAKGILTQKQMGDQILGGFGQILASNDKARALAYVNEVAQVPELAPGFAGKKLVGIHAVGAKSDTGDDRGFQLVAEDGSVSPTLPYSAIQASMSQLKSGKYSASHTSDGAVHVLNENTGALTTPVAANPALARGLGLSTNAHTPALLQMANAYMAAPENAGMTFSEAMSKVKTQMEKPRHQAILELVGKNMPLGGNGDPNAEYQKWADLYDRAKGTASVPGLSNVQAPFKLDPKFQNLFTLEHK